MRHVIVSAVILNILAGISVFAGGYAALLSPFWSFAISCAVSSTAKTSRLTLGVLLGLPYYLALCCYSWRFVASSPDSIRAYGIPPFDQFSAVVIAASILGAIAGIAGKWLISSIGNRTYDAEECRTKP